MQHQLALTLPLAGLALLASCDHNGYNDGVVVVGPSVSFIGEQEPNNSAFDATGVGPVGPFEDLVLTGWVSGFDGFGADGVDGWALQANGPIRVDFALEGTSAGFHDLDLCLYDPYQDVYLECWESPDDDEFGTLFIYEPGFEFHLVVIAYNASSSYELALQVTPLPLAATSLDGDEAQLRNEDGQAIEGAKRSRASAAELYRKSSFGAELELTVMERAALDLELAARRNQAIETLEEQLSR